MGMVRKKWIRFSSVGLAAAVIVALLLTLIPARVTITGEGHLSFSVSYALANPAGVTFRSVGTTTGGSGSTCVIAKPSGLAVDDLMVAHVFIEIFSVGTITSPGGWTEIRQDLGSTYRRSALYWKIAVQADVNASNFTFTLSKVHLRLGTITAWTGHDPTTPINAHSGQYTASSSTVTAPTITPSVANCVICLFCGTSNDTTQSGYAIANDNPAVWSERYDFLTFSGGDAACAMGSATRPETTATGNGTATMSQSTSNIGQLIAIAPTEPDISNTPASKAFGAVTAGTDYWSSGSAPTWPLDDAECHFTITNSGNTCSITIKATNFTGGVGWTLGAPAESVVRLKAGKSGDSLEANMVTLTTGEQSFISALAGSATKKWEVLMETPTSFTDAVEKTSTITLTATLD